MSGKKPQISIRAYSADFLDYLLCGFLSPICWPGGSHYLPVSPIAGLFVGAFLGGTVGLAVAALVDRKSFAASRSLIWIPTFVATLGVSALNAPGMPFTAPAVCAVSSLCMAAIARAVLRDVVLGENRCGSCGYDLAGIEVGTCPECGKPVDRAPSNRKGVRDGPKANHA